MNGKGADRMKDIATAKEFIKILECKSDKFLLELALLSISIVKDRE